MAQALDVSKLRRIIRDESLEDGVKELLSIEAEEAPLLSETLQSEAESCDSTKWYRKICTKYLSTLSKRYRSLPPSLFIDDVTCLDGYPFSGGGFAVIYRGRQGTRLVCLKVLRMFLESDNMAKDRLLSAFYHEAPLWRQLRHPNILPLLGVNTNVFAPGFCLVSPWMKNGTIMSYLRNNPTHDKLAIITEIPAGMEYLHSLDPLIIHGDIRGANILVTDNLRCCLADFGLAVAAESQAVTSTSHGMQGSLRWMAPEVIHPKPFTPTDTCAHDVYAFACTVLEIITGANPYANLIVEPAVMFQVLSGRRPDRPRNVWCPDGVWSLVERCWAHNPQERPTAKHTLDHLRELQSQRPVPTTLHPLDQEWGGEDPTELPACLDPDYLLLASTQDTMVPVMDIRQSTTPPRPSTPQNSLNVLGALLGNEGENDVATPRVRRIAKLQRARQNENLQQLDSRSSQRRARASGRRSRDTENVAGLAEGSSSTPDPRLWTHLWAVTHK